MRVCYTFAADSAQWVCQVSAGFDTTFPPRASQRSQRLLERLSWVSSKFATDLIFSMLNFPSRVQHIHDFGVLLTDQRMCNSRFQGCFKSLHFFAFWHLGLLPKLEYLLVIFVYCFVTRFYHHCVQLFFGLLSEYVNFHAVFYLLIESLHGQTFRVGTNLCI